MEKSKLLDVLRTFTAAEWSRFELFLDSPYFNRRAEVRQLFAYLKLQAGAGFPTAALDNRAVFSAVHPDRPFSPQRLNHLKNWLLQSAEVFLQLERFQQDELNGQWHLLSAYLDRDLDKHFLFQWRKSRRRLEKEDREAPSGYWHRYRLWEVMEQRVGRRNERKYSEALQLANDRLDQFYFLQKARYLSEMLDMQQFISGHYELSMLDALCRRLETNEAELPPLLKVYWQLLKLFERTDNDPSFEGFLATWRTYLPRFDAADAKRLLYHAINYCVYRVNRGERDYAEPLMQLYREGTQSGILLDKGVLSPWTFKNMVRLGLGLKQYPWVEAFVREYSDKLPEKEKRDALHYNLADLHYHQKQYDQAMDYLNRVEYTDVHYHLGAKVMLLKIYFEKGEEDAFWSLLSAFQVFLRRNRSVAKNVKRAYAQFAVLAGKVFRMRRGEAEQLRQKIEQAPTVNARSWLLRQVDRQTAVN